jgi:hypothetical protein
MAWTSLAGDEDRLNDTLKQKVTATWTPEYSYDDGIPAAEFSWLLGGYGIGVRFLAQSYPARLIGVRFGLHSDCSPYPGGDSFRVRVLDDDGFRHTPGTVLLDTGTLQGRRGAWNEIFLTSRNIIVDSGSIYVFIIQWGNHPYSPAWNLDMADDGPDSSQWVFSPWNGYGVKAASPDMSPPGDFLIRASLCEVEGDVGVVGITAPADTVIENTLVVPTAWIRSFCGKVIDHFPVMFKIGSVYAQTVTVPCLNPGDSTLVSFPSWTARRGHYAIACSTGFAGDSNPVNNRISDSIVVWLRDIGINEIISPPASTPLGDSVIPVVSVGDFGTTSETCLVTMTISRSAAEIYRESSWAAIPAGGITLESLPPWRADSVGDHHVIACSKLTGDMNPRNDTATATVHVFYRDVGVTGILAPRDTVRWNDSVVPTLGVKNLGSDAETFWVWFRIMKGQSVAHFDSVRTLVRAGESLNATLPVWWADTGAFVGLAYANLSGDRNRHDDSTTNTFVSVWRDVGISRVVNPFGNLPLGDTIAPQVLVRNYGSTDEETPVTVRIKRDGAAVYLESALVFVVAGDSVVQTFPAWYADSVGSDSIVGWTELSQDMAPSNDTARFGFRVCYRDVGVEEVIWPRDTVKIGTPPVFAAKTVASLFSIVPVARVRNSGSEPETFFTWLLIARRMGTPPVFGAKTGSVPVWVVYCDSEEWFLHPAETLTVAFTPWSADTGAFRVVAYTNLAGDRNRGNDSVAGTFVVVRHDVGIAGILEPQGTIDRDTTVRPRAIALNCGSVTESFLTVFAIMMSGDTVYAESSFVTIAPGDSEEISFLSWHPDTVADYGAMALARLSTDQDTANDTARISFSVRHVLLHDVGATRILGPADSVLVDSLVWPEAMVKNFGRCGESFAVVFVILENRDTTGFRGENGSVPILETNGTYQISNSKSAGHGRDARATVLLYADTALVTLGPGDSTVVDSFVSWRPGSAGDYQAFAQTVLSGDLDPSNDAIYARFIVYHIQVHDVGVQAILAPAGSIDTGATVVPVARVMNLGDFPETFPARFSIFDPTGTRIYERTVLLANLGSGQDTVVSFPSLRLEGTGEYSGRCSVSLASDQNPANDSLGVRFRVQGPSPWKRVADIPPGPRKKCVKTGAALAGGGPGTIYALKGNHTREFLCYDAMGDSWTPKCSISGVLQVGRGGTLCYCPATNRLYASKGNNSGEFWEYSPGMGTPKTGTPPEAGSVPIFGAKTGSVPGEEDSWRQLAAIPAGATGMRAASGACLAALDTGPVYLLRGGGSLELCCYDPTHDRWSQCSAVPVGQNGHGCRAGSALIAVRDYLYLVRSFDNGLMAYSTQEDTWYERNPLPLVGRAGKRRRARPGTSMTHDQDIVYLVKGGRSGELWRYCTFGDTWTQLEDLPRGLSGRSAAAGGAIAWADASSPGGGASQKEADISREPGTNHENRDTTGFRGENGSVPIFQRGRRCWSVANSHVSHQPSAGHVYALKGNNTLEFWRYSPTADRLPLSANRHNISSSPGSQISASVALSGATIARRGTTISGQLPAHATARLYDACGRLCAVLAKRSATPERQIFGLTENLSPGVYFLALTAEGYSPRGYCFTRKLVLQ